MNQICRKRNMGLLDQIKGDLEKAFGDFSLQESSLLTNAKAIEKKLNTNQAYLTHTQQEFDSEEIDEATYSLLKKKYESEISEAITKLKQIRIDYKTTKHQTEQRLIKNRGEVVIMEKDLDQTMKMYEKGLIPETEYKKKTNFVPSKIKQLQNQIKNDEKTLVELESVSQLFSSREE